MDKIKNSFFNTETNLESIENINKKLNLDNRPYYLAIKKFNQEFLYDIVDTIYALQSDFNQPFLLSKGTIRNILKNFLPYIFFLSLSKEEAFRLKKELRINENWDLFIVIKKREHFGISVFTYTNNFFNLNLNFYSKVNQDSIVNFFQDYTSFLENNFYKKVSLETENITDLYGNRPVVLFDGLSIQQAILLIYYFSNRHQDLPIDLMLTETRILQKKEKVKWNI